MVVVIVMYINNYVNSEVEYVKSNIDHRSYLVLSLPDKQEASNYLATINQDLLKVIKHLRAKYPENPDFKRLYTNFDPNAVSEGSPDSSYTSYSINKRQLVICLRQTDHSFVDKNVLLYVVLHELGHFACKEVGHTPKFWEIFKTIMIEAVNIGVYKKVDFKNKPEPYCGIKITSSVI